MEHPALGLPADRYDFEEETIEADATKAIIDLYIALDIGVRAAMEDAAKMVRLLRADHPTCARPDGTVWCGHYKEMPDPGTSREPLRGYCAFLQRGFLFRNHPIQVCPSEFYCPRHTALAGEEKP
jgi:hypothetical protein